MDERSPLGSSGHFEYVHLVCCDEIITEGKKFRSSSEILNVDERFMRISIHDFCNVLKRFLKIRSGYLKVQTFKLNLESLISSYTINV